MSTYALPEGWANNPLKGRARNLACPCASGQKVKRCCGQYPILPVETVRAIRFWLRSRGLR